MGERIRGYQNAEIIRKVCGSPAVWYSFTNVVEKVEVANLGGVSDVFVRFDGAATAAGSNSGILWSGGELSKQTFPVRTGSLSIVGSGAGSPFVQATGYY